MVGGLLAAPPGRPVGTPSPPSREPNAPPRPGRGGRGPGAPCPQWPGLTRPACPLVTQSLANDCGEGLTRGWMPAGRERGLKWGGGRRGTGAGPGAGGGSGGLGAVPGSGGRGDSREEVWGPGICQGWPEDPGA